MSLTEKYSFHLFPLTLFPFSKPHPPSPSVKPFDESLIFRLKSLLPIPSSSPSIPLSWLILAVDLLSSTLSDAATLISDPSLRGSDRSALASHLDSSVALLDAVNFISAEIDRLSRLRLHIRFALHLLSKMTSPDNIRRARDSIKEWEKSPRPAIRFSPRDLIRGDTPCGKFSAVHRAIYAVEAVSALVIGTVLAVLGEKGDLAGIRVSGEFPWADAFNGVLAAVSGKIGVGFAGEIEAVGASVKRLTAVIDSEDNGEKIKRLRSAVEETEKATEDLTAALDRLSNAVNALFRAALCTRDTALQSFRIGTQKCK